MKTSILVLVLGLLGAACVVNRSNPRRRSALDRNFKIMPHDEHSHARPNEVRVDHLDLDWTVDFERERLEGTATWRLTRRDAQAPLRLDVKSLDIHGVEAGRDGIFHAAVYEVQPGDPVLGDTLQVELEPDDDLVRVRYATTEAGTGLQWLEPSQTRGGKHPFLFSQSQAIHARTWIPCQDTPGVRVTYRAVVRTGNGLRAVMSASETRELESEGDQRVFVFEMPHRIPSYLIALAVGDLEFRSLGPRSGVYAEPEVVEAAASEFRDTESMIDAIEDLYGPYRWGRYDLLVLPPSFPFGGMENPCLTFATPTILAGDRSLVSLVAHELAHSWSGNLVTNATWRDFWLNEGFTVYLEQRAMERVYGAERKKMEVMLGMQELREEMEELPPKDQILHVDLAGRDPDEGFTGVPYEKGAAFLRLLESTFGRDRFDEFLKSWFDEHAFTSVTTEDFVAFLEARLLRSDHERAATVDIRAWIEEPGLPADAPDARSEAFERIDTLVADWKAGRNSLEAWPVERWVTHEWLHFIRSLGESQKQETLAEIDRRFHLTESGNSEILAAWLELCIHSRYEAAWPALRSFLLRQGRRKFLKPLYEAMAKDPTLRGMARDIYAEARAGYHAISRDSMDKVLHWN